MNLQNIHKYDDILGQHRPPSRRARMTNRDRAAQFSPFAALTGFDAAIEETGRLTDRRIELDEDGRQLLDEQMRAVLDMIHTRPEVKIVWFRHDERKTGGSYVTTTGRAKKVDTYTRKILLTDGRMIPLPEIFSITVIR